MSITMKILQYAVLSAVILFVAGCGKQEQKSGEEKVTALYEKAASYADNLEYEKALDLLQKGLALDTLAGFSGRTAKALNRKRQIEEVVGDYFHALASHDILEKRCKGMLPESAEAERVRSKASLLGELGEFVMAQETLKNIAALNVRDSLELARYHERAGEKEKAFAFYNVLSRNPDRVVGLRAYTGLLQLSLGGDVKEAAEPSVYAHRITEVAGKLISEKREEDKRAVLLALRRAAAMLELFPAHMKDSSYLYFKALSLARTAGDDHLTQLLDFESNAVLTNNPEVYARALDYFERNNMRLARMAALLKQGIRGDIEDREKVKALKQGLDIYLHQVCPWPGYGIADLVDRSAEKLTELLLNNGRYAEAFESDEMPKLYELNRSVQLDYDSFDLSGQHDQLEHKVAVLGRELSALLQRLMNSFESGQGFEHHAATINAISKKRGLLYDLQAELRSVAPSEAAKLTVVPVTLKTVQESLGEGHAVLKVVEGREWCTVFLVQSGYVEVSRRKVKAGLYRSRLQLFRDHLSMDSGGGNIVLAANSERLWLTDLLIKPYSGRLRDIHRLTVIADNPVPAHLLGHNRYLVRDLPVSGIYSASELVRQSSTTGGGDDDPVFGFYGIDRYREAVKRKFSFPHHAVFLLWKPFSAAELEELRVLLALSMQKGGNPSDVLHQLAQQQEAENNIQWLYISEYGVSNR